MNERTWERLGAASGLVAAVLLLAGLLVAPGALALDARPGMMIAFIRPAVLTATLLITLGAVAFMWFVAHLRHVLQRAEKGAEAFSPVVLVSGVSLATMTALAMVPLTVLATLATRPAGLGEIEVARALYAVHQLSLGPIGLIAALFAVSAGTAMVRREIAGPWLGWLGVLVAVIGLIAGIGSFFAAAPGVIVLLAYVLGIAFALWIAAASIMMLVRPEVERTRAPREVFAH
ncbi:hypothetical protein [Nonomuraea jabiensis]|uniref:hypothetical protein n=1 Tax=Nonomuraea jabiensis TaxID=882448 RepID=UPI003D73B506